MKATKRVLAVALVVVLLFSVVSVSATAATSKLGYMVPTDSKFTKTVSTVNVYGNYDYVNFKLNYKGSFTYFAFFVFSDSAMQKLVASDSVMKSEDGVYKYSTLLDLRGLKSGTYYCATVGYEDWGNYVDVDKNSLKTFKLKVNRNATFDKQIVVIKSRLPSLNGPVIKWNKLEGATKYIVYRRPANATKWTRLGTTTSLSFTDKTLMEKTGSYIYTVKAQNKRNVTSRYFYAGAYINYVGAPKIKSLKITGNDCTVTWNRIPGADGYRVYRKGPDGSWYKLDDIYENVTSFTDKRGKSSGCKFYYTVKAFKYYDYNGYGIDGCIESEFYTDKSIVFVTAPKVTSIQTTADNATIIKWTNVYNSTYTVYRKVEGSGWSILAKNYDEVSFIDRTAKQDGTNYFYTVRATQNTSYGDVRGHYIASDGFAFTAMPENIVVSGTQTGVKITWDAVESAKSYTVYSKNVRGLGSWVRVGTADDNEFIDTTSGVVGARIYTVRSEGETARGSYSGEGVVYFNPEAPTLTINGEDGKYTISWNVVEGADDYAIYKKVDGGEWILLDTTSATSYEDELIEDGIYSYSVVALKGEMNGMFDDIGYSVSHVNLV